MRVDEDVRTIVWPNGPDPDPDWLHGDFTVGASSPQSQVS